MSGKPVVFISYSHQDEPNHPHDGQDRWFSYVKSHLNPLVESGLIDIWHDRHIEGGADWEAKILEKLSTCDVCLLLVSRHSLVSQFILKVEIRTMLERRESEGAHIYPILLTPTSIAGAGNDWLRRMNIRPRDKRALSGMSPHDRDQTMVELVEEIANIAARVAEERRQGPDAVASTPISSVLAAPVTDLDNEVRCIDQHEPKPEIFGREVEVDAIVEAVLAGKSALIAGGPGMGKTAVATAGLYDPRVVQKFGKRRVFAPLDSATEPRALLTQLVDALSMPATGDNVSLLRLIENYAATHPLVAILDNAETVFDADRSEPERLLKLVGQIDGLSVVVTIRGTPPSVPGALGHRLIISQPDAD